MDLRLTEEQELLVEAFASLYAKHASTDRVREMEPVGFDRSLWALLLEQGVIEMAVKEEQGGWGASALDLALISEQHGRSIAPAPLIEAQVAARLLGRLGSSRLERALSGERLITLGLHAAAAGSARGVPAGAVADDAVIWTGSEILLVPLDGGRTDYENLGSMPFADVAVEDGEVLASGTEALEAFELALDDWLLLTSAALVGAAARSLEIGLAYVKERKAFDVPIGSFQAVAHRLADSATAIDGSRLLTYEAAWAAESDVAHARELAALAFAFAGESARDSSYRALHFHGGYGFMLEYDIQLFWRRARAWPLAWDEPAAGYRRAADARYRRR